MEDRKISPRTTEDKDTDREETKSPRAYVPPRIITHSAAKLQNATYAVNACASFVP